MQYKVLSPIRDYLKYSDGLTKTLSAELYWKIFRPLLDVLEMKRENAKQSVLINAFLTRTIYYHDGYVYGKFSGSISKALRDLGGTFNNTKKAFKIDLAKFPIDVKSAQAQGSMAEANAIEKLQKNLQELTATNIIIPALEENAESTLKSLHEQFKKVTPQDLEIPIQLEDYKHEQMIKDYTANIHLSINNLAADTTYKLRQRVEDAVGQGIRAGKLKEILMAEYGIAHNKAKFVAQQETRLFTAQYTQIRYQDAGIDLYQWSTSNDQRVRDDHKELNGKIFRFDDPPVSNKQTGAKNNPGQDFGCRCRALPVILQPGKRFTPGMQTGNLLETEEHQLLHAGVR